MGGRASDRVRYLREGREDVEYEVLGARTHELVDQHAHLRSYGGRREVTGRA